jgi:hypothetical protein
LAEKTPQERDDMPGIDLTWDIYLNNDPKQGDMAQANLVSCWVSTRARDWSLQMSWPATGTPVGTLSYETSNDRINASPIDTSLLLPAPDNPAGTADEVTINGDDLNALWVRAKYARTSGGTAAALKGKLGRAG